MSRQRKNPYPNRNFSVVADYLEELVLWNSGEKGRKPIEESENGYEDVAVTDQEAVSLTVPENAISGEIHVEADQSGNVLRAIRYKMNGTAPTLSSGMILGDGDTIEVYGKENLEAFQVIGIEADKSHVLRVQYYQTIQQ